ncbi:MAG: RNA polymerase sigma-54 factor [Phycisphaerae bacterium]|nr:MAG: RNA polymerase sigma-54 factor [Phycisphaerae bacterium]
MRFETSQHLKMGQSMRLAPRMIQSMEILQMSLAELEERIQQELESNPTLELVEGAPDAERPPADTSPDDSRPLSLSGEASAEEFERLDSYEQSNPDAVENEYAQDMTRSEAPEATYEPYEGPRHSSGDDRDAKAEAIAAAPAKGQSLADHLRGQWALVDVEAGLRPLGELIIAHLEDDGYLRTPLEDLIPKANLTPPPAVEQLRRALHAAQLLLEPAGVAARDARECLLLQLDALEDSGDFGWPATTFVNARRLVESHLEDIGQNRLPRIAEKTGLSLDDIKEALSLLRRLSLAPARRLVDDDVKPITPDAIVEYDETQDRYIAYLNDSRLPNVRINQEYAKLAKDRGADRRDREFLKTNLSNAQWLLDAVGQRRHTLLRVVREVVEAQREFFDFGPQALRPLPMTGVAEKLGIHVATVSRAVADKFIATPRGVLPLRKFFSGGVSTTGGAGDKGEMAWDAIKASLQEVIAAEDRTHPFSDEQLVDELKKRGIEIARRTVAKYRDQLNIQPARLRKAF